MLETKVHLLDNDVIGKISAGEVAERPVSVIKELVENSIDAGARSIHVEIENAGQTLIRVSDDGCGMTAEDVRLACLRHATSKLQCIEDLNTLVTLGFRGEALASIAAVSRLEITSASTGEGEAVYIYLEGGEMHNSRPAARAQGTTVAVRNLFYNVPARKKFLKKESTELAMIMDTFGRHILANPNIEFKLIHGDRSMMHASRDMGAWDRVRLVLGTDVAGNMVDVDFQADGYKISGYISVPASTRKDKKSQIFFVNKRFVKSKILNASLQDAYRSLLERGRYPSCVLFIDVDPGAVDVNIHPTKLLVKFDDETTLKKVTERAIRERFDEIKEAREEGIPVAKKLSETPILTDVSEVQPEFEYEMTKVEKLEPVLNTRNDHNLPCEGEMPVSREDIFQVGDCYILRMQNDSIFITDQHAAHERILYEYFTKVVRERGGDIQNLLFPVRMDLSASEAIIMDKMVDKFKALGFVIEPFGNNSYVVQGAPAILQDKDIKTVVMDILTDLSSCDLDKIDPVETMIKYASCRAAIKAGDKLSNNEMVVLLNKLEECELPFTCPHGRPTSTEITIDELEKRFRRK